MNHTTTVTTETGDDPRKLFWFAVYLLIMAVAALPLFGWRIPQIFPYVPTLVVHEFAAFAFVGHTFFSNIWSLNIRRNQPREFGIWARQHMRVLCLSITGPMAVITPLAGLMVVENWGGLAGAAPPLLGWCAITGEVAIQPMLLVLIVFVWTPPHFWPLAIRRRKEYARVNVPMLPVTHGVRFTKQQIFLYSLMLLAVSLLPVVIKMSGYLYLSGAVLLGLGFIYHAAMLLTTEGDKRAMKTFGYSIIYLSLLFCFLLLDHYVVMAFPGLGI